MCGSCTILFVVGPNVTMPHAPVCLLGVCLQLAGVLACFGSANSRGQVMAPEEGWVNRVVQSAKETRRDSLRLAVYG